MRARCVALRQRARLVAPGLPAALLGLAGGLVWAPLTTVQGRGIACALSCAALVLAWGTRRPAPPPDTALAARNAALTRANARLAALATTDALTALPNQRALGDILEREVDRARRYGRGLAVLVLDLDHFKALNDGHGHAAGDAALRELAVVARAALRDVDVLGRWGGFRWDVLRYSMLWSDDGTEEERHAVSAVRRKPLHEGGARSGWSANLPVHDL